MPRSRCPACGATAGAGARFCGTCGARLASARERDDRDATATRRRIAVAAGVAVLMVAAGLAVVDRDPLGDGSPAGDQQPGRPAPAASPSPAVDPREGGVAVPGTPPPAGSTAAAPEAPPCVVDGGGQGREVACVRWAATDLRPGPAAATAVLGGRVLAVPDGDALAAVGIARGERRWRVQLPGGAVRPVATPPGLVVVATTDGLVALGETDGTVQWSAPVVPEEVAHVGPWLLVRAQRELAAVAAGTGRIAWRRPLRVREQVVLTDELALTYDGRMLAGLSSNTGEVRWRREVGSLAGAPDVAGGMLLVLGQSGAVTGLDLDGDLRLPPTAPLTAAPRDAAFGASADAVDIAAAVGDTGAAFPGRLVRIDPATGAVLWDRSLPQPLEPYRVTIDDDLVLVTVGDGLVAVGLDAGEERFVLRQGAVLNDLALLPDGELLLATASGLVGLDPETGERRWHLRSGDTHLLSSHPLLIATRDGAFAVRPPD